MIKPVYLYITPFFPTPTWHSGIYSFDFVQGLKRLSKYDIRVVVLGNGVSYEFEGVKVASLKTFSLPSGVAPFLCARLNNRRFFKLLHAQGIDVVNVAVCHVHTTACEPYACCLQRVNPKCKTVLHHHDLASFGLRLGRFRHFWLHKIFMYFWLRRMHEMMDVHVFISEASRQSFLRFPDTSWSVFEDYRKIGKGLGFCRPVCVKKSIVLWNGVDVTIFNQNAPRIEHNGFIIGCVANFIEVKDHISLIKAVEILRGKIPGLKLRLLGNSGFGGFYQQAVAYVERHHLTDIVLFESNCRHEQLADFYRGIDLFVLPSFFEGFGCVLTEAYACGTNFMACEGQGADDLILEEERKYWLFKPRDPIDMAQKILKYYRNRPRQTLTNAIDIDSVLQKFLKEV